MSTVCIEPSSCPDAWAEVKSIKICERSFEAAEFDVHLQACALQFDKLSNLPIILYSF